MCLLLIHGLDITNMFQGYHDLLVSQGTYLTIQALPGILAAKPHISSVLEHQGQRIKS